ncbi:TIGR04219 family outer membrane beta-barrel protein [bacterium]|nr:TIGR04219 family outer membrane beta-barrel protein [bacterium]MBU1989856.1 TIGR04219 family outer membrane beta-barrel protein [bacterium]
MKKILSTLACGIVLATTASADFARVEMGAGAWMQKPSGEISYTDGVSSGSDKSLEKEETQNYAWLLIKHPVPIIPNLRVEYVSLKNTGEATGTFKNFTIPATSATSLEMTQFDIIPYYNILDNTFWITLDLGVDLKVMNMSYTADGVTIPGSTDTSYSDTTSIALPMLYARVRTEIPVTNIGVEADVKYVTSGSSTIYDARAKVDYTLDFFPVIQPALELGYRVQKIKIDEDSVDAKMDLDFSGVYAGLMLRF